MTYAGTAMGSSNAHSSRRRPGKRHIVVSQAVVIPMVITPYATPSISPSEFTMYSGRTVAARCDHVPSLGRKTLSTTTTTGTASSTASDTASTLSVPGRLTLSGVGAVLASAVLFIVAVARESSG